MYKSIACIAFFCLAAVSAGVIETHHVVQEPVLTKVGSVVHSAPSAVSHQSFTRYHNKAVVSPVLTPVVKTTVHAAPVVSVVKSAPVVHTYEAAPVHTVHSAPVVHSYPVVHSAPVVQHVHAAPATYSFHH
ncbi:pupal cuticle protein C1B-like [Calliphora vicina]|uniref:pupal cuticle protein C1B-like n=1 Tax=Calliphora vicina TaxID=7373 RepID=UPI00325B7C8E